jgi:hypothetical protein
MRRGWLREKSNFDSLLIIALLPKCIWRVPGTVSLLPAHLLQCRLLEDENISQQRIYGIFSCGTDCSTGARLESGEREN